MEAHSLLKANGFQVQLCYLVTQVCCQSSHKFWFELQVCTVQAASSALRTTPDQIRHSLCQVRFWALAVAKLVVYSMAHFDARPCVSLKVESYGTGQKVKLPGQSIQEPVIYDFGTPYSHMLQDLRKRGEEHYRKRGILQMLERNDGVKSAPERWQDEK